MLRFVCVYSKRNFSIAAAQVRTKKYNENEKKLFTKKKPATKQKNEKYSSCWS